MNKKLNCILLIDDDEATNFFHELVINEAEITDQIVTVESGREALEFLKKAADGQVTKPDLIFLDINMPAMNGWEFFKAYNDLYASEKGEVVVVMLTTSPNPDDKARARARGEGLISEYLNKPLTKESLHVVIEQYINQDRS
jgi:CheY-like chemotaxis protein